MIKHQIWIIDFGSQYTQLLTRRLRELNHSSIIMTVDQALKKIKTSSPEAIVLSGGPQSIFEDDHDYSPLFDNEKLPILGVCYGIQLLAHYFKGTVERGSIGEYGSADILFESNFSLEGQTLKKANVWMSHFDHISKVPSDFQLILKSENGLIAGMKHASRPIVGYQFHPEVDHTECGRDFLKFFLKDIANLNEDWTDKKMLEEAYNEVKAIGKANVLCAFSGGVDSLVAATLTNNVLEGEIHCFFVDNGLLRPQDYGHIKMLQEKTNLNIEILDVKDIFLNKLKGLSDPEDKRKAIGNTFIDVFEQKVNEYKNDHGIEFDYLLQGTLYPDVIESISPHSKGGKSATIKSHHNVGGLPEKMNLKLLEPLRFLFKDEVRNLGVELGLKWEWVHRHPFPGPGIGIRVLGELTETRISQVQKSDQILFEELKNGDFYHSTWQAFTVLLPVKTVGVKGDGRAFEEVICLRMVGSSDGMTATFSELPFSFLDKVSRRITNEVPGITRVVYDITSKPPGTIEWE